MITLVSLVVATIAGGRVGFSNELVIAGFAVSLVAGAAFVAIERGSRSPMLPLPLFASRTFSVCAAVGLLINTAFYGLIFVFSLLFQRGQHLSPLQTGVALVPVMVAVTVSNLYAGRVAERLGVRRALTVGALLTGLGCAGLLGVSGSTQYLGLAAQLAAIGLGGGLIIPIITSELLGSVERSRSGVAAGTLNTLRQAGSAIGVALYGSMLASGLIAGAHLALIVSVGLAVAIGALARTLSPGP